jgi:hypothetical protein
MIFIKFNGIRMLCILWVLNFPIYGGYKQDNIYGTNVREPADIVTVMHRGGGFFCELRKVVENIIHYESDGIRSHYVNWTDEFFPFKDAPHENGWDLYFEPIKSYEKYSEKNVRSVGNCFVHELHDQVCVAPWVAYDDYLPFRQYVHEVFNKYITIKPQITDFVDSFYQKHMKGCLCIGLHVRYAAVHNAETPQGHPSLEQYCAEVDNLTPIR